MDTVFLDWTRPRSYWDVVGAHLPLALATGIALLAPHWITHDALPLRGCTFLALTGYPCPFCGFTRSFWAMSAGDWTFAVHNSPFGCLGYIATAFIFAWNAAGLLLGLRIERGLFLRRRPGWVGWAFAITGVLLLLNWVYRLSLGLK